MLKNICLGSSLFAAAMACDPTGNFTTPSPATTADPTLSSVLSSAHVSATASNATAHGPVAPFTDKNPLPIHSTTTSSERYAPTVDWTQLKDGDFIDWSNYNASGANLGGWLAKEKTHDPIWWAEHAPDADDEWTLCKMLGDRCGPVLEDRYKSFLNKTTIDQLGAVGVNTLRIPTTYAAWVEVPGSELYTGGQKSILREITNYAIEKYNMHVVSKLDLVCRSDIG